MTEEEFRTAIMLSEDRINLKLERDKRTLQVKYMRKGRAFQKNPDLYTFTFAYEELVKAAKDEMASEAEEIELAFYRSQGVI